MNDSKLVDRYEKFLVELKPLVSGDIENLINSALKNIGGYIQINDSEEKGNN